MYNLYLSNPVLSLYDGDVADPPAGGLDPANVVVDPPANPPTKIVNPDDPAAPINVDPNARFDQDQVNKIVQERLAKERKKNETQYKELEKTYQDLLANHSLTEDERTDLQTRLEDLQKQNRTKEEQAKHEKRQLQEQYATQISELEEKAAYWEKEHKDFLVEKSLLEAAHAHDAFMPQQIFAIVREWTKLVDATDETGKPTGKLTPMVDLQDVDADTQKPIITQRTPMEAVERLKELQPNLFKSNIVSGVGGNSSTGDVTPGANGQIDAGSLTTDQFMKIYKEDPTKLGLRAKRRV